MLFVSSVSFGELRKGIILGSPGKRSAQLQAWIETDLSILFSGRTLPVTRSIAERCGVLEGQRQLAGRPLNVPDGQIAPTAIEHGLTLVARNVKRLCGSWRHDLQSLGWRLNLQDTALVPEAHSVRRTLRKTRESEYGVPLRQISSTG